MNEFIEEWNICQEGAVYSKKELISTTQTHNYVQSIGDLPMQQTGSSREAQNPTAP